MRRCKGLGLAVFLALLSVEPAALAETPQSDLTKTKRALEDTLARQRGLSTKARKVAAEAEKIRNRSVELAAVIQAREVEATALERRLEELQRDRADKMASLRRHWRQAGGLTIALQRMALFPQEALIVFPRQPEETVRAAILLRSILPEVQTRADVLRGILETLSQTERKMSQQHEQLVRTYDDLRSKRATLERILARKLTLRGDLVAKAARETARAKKLAAKSTSLEELVNRLKEDMDSEERGGAQTKRITVSRSISSARGTLPYPVRGEVVLLYGQKKQPGLSSKGIEIATRPGAQVIAPFDGVVVFSGGFRGYGQLLIIEHGGGYHSLLAGMDRINTVMGQFVLAGEPVGGMAVSGVKRSILYLELRRNSRPINPLPWLVSQKDNISG